jgi:WASH complex subunit strumpellin
MLYFCPSVLVKEMATMREIVDKHFADNWVLSYYMGLTVDLSEAWEPFKAANAALANIIDKDVVAELNEKFSSKVPKLLAQLKQLLTEGVLIEQFVLENIAKLLNTLRECNTTIRWLMMQRNSKSKRIRDLIEASTSADTVLLLLLNTAQFEYVLKNMFTELMETKRARWDEYQKESKERMDELAEYFSGEKALARVKRDDNLRTWFTNLANEISALEFERPTQTGRKITNLMQVLEEVQEFHQIETSLQIKQFLADTRVYLTKMIRTVNIKETMLNTIAIVSDFSYAWEIISDYIPLMHERIQKDPSCVLFLRATFLKLVSILDLPLLRIQQCGSKDVVSVSEYYSSALVRFVRSVLSVVPQNMFRILNDIIKLLTYDMRPVPMKLERLHLKEFSQLDMRQKLARDTHEVRNPLKTICSAC